MRSGYIPRGVRSLFPSRPMHSWTTQIKTFPLLSSLLSLFFLFANLNRTRMCRTDTTCYPHPVTEKFRGRGWQVGGHRDWAWGGGGGGMQRGGFPRCSARGVHVKLSGVRSNRHVSWKTSEGPTQPRSLSRSWFSGRKSVSRVS